MLMKWVKSLKATTKTGTDLFVIFLLKTTALDLLGFVFLFRFSSLGKVFIRGCGSHQNSDVTAISGRPMMKFESGYTVETVFDGSKLGIEPYSLEVLPSGELLILDSANSNLYRISSSLSLCKLPSIILKIFCFG